jgi:hypothetical protein
MTLMFPVSAPVKLRIPQRASAAVSVTSLDPATLLLKRPMTPTGSTHARWSVLLVTALELVTLV